MQLKISKIWRLVTSKQLQRYRSYLSLSLEKIKRLFHTWSCPASKVVFGRPFVVSSWLFINIFSISFLFQVFYVLHSTIVLHVLKFRSVFLFNRSWISAASILGHICLWLQCAWFPWLPSLATTQQYTAHFCAYYSRCEVHLKLPSFVWNSLLCVICYEISYW